MTSVCNNCCLGYAVILFHVVGRAVRPHPEAGAPACEEQAAQLCEWRVIPLSTYIHIQPPTLNHFSTS